MILCTAKTLDALRSAIAERYGVSRERIGVEPAPGDEGRWFVTKDGYVLSGLHAVLRCGDYEFKVIGG